jgi:hypothetical protein
VALAKDYKIGDKDYISEKGYSHHRSMACWKFGRRSSSAFSKAAAADSLGRTNPLMLADNGEGAGLAVGMHW